ncbi:MAG TPA: hypothetical protein VFS37_02015, partial [Conexibacter sp.]|nr:hypothetical protein [Conexibacter sp.]
ARLQLALRAPKAAHAAAARATREATRLGLPAEAREARALARAAWRARALPPLALLYAWRRPLRLTDAPIGGD